MPIDTDPHARSVCMCLGCEGRFDATHVPDFCGACGEIGGRWLLIHMDVDIRGATLGMRMEYEAVGPWTDWQVSTLSKHLGTPVRRLPER